MTTLALWLVDNIVFQDQQANAELAKIMGEFTESGDQSPSASSKGDDLLAMMDGLWHGHPNRNSSAGVAQCIVNSRSCSTVDQSAVCICKYNAETSHAARKKTCFFGCFLKCRWSRCFHWLSNDELQICIVTNEEGDEPSFKLLYTVIVCLL